MERAVFDDPGQLLTASFLDYCMPRAAICGVRFRDAQRAVDDRPDGPQRRRRSGVDRVYASGDERRRRRALARLQESRTSTCRRRRSRCTTRSGARALAHRGYSASHDAQRGLDFLGVWPFHFESPEKEGWISLDFLQFLVQISTSQWVMRKDGGKFFPLAFSPDGRSADTAASRFRPEKGTEFMGRACLNFCFSASNRRLL